MNEQQLRAALGNGLLSFPVTDMDDRGQFDKDGYQARLEWFASMDVSALFVAGGTGEFFSLSREEYRQIVGMAKRIAGKKIPVISSVGRSIPEAIELAKIAEDSGVDGLLLMPPYLTGCPPEGAIAYASAIMKNTRLPVIYYNRSNAVLGAEDLQVLAGTCPNMIGLKDGTGNMQELNDTIKTLAGRLVYIGGVPTAEIISEAYLSIGVNTYSSAVFNFVPELALYFYRALRSGNQEVVSMVLKEFYIPFVRLRSRKRGYAVSLIKAGAELIGRSAGDVRPPLVMPNEAERRLLSELIDRSRNLF